MSPTGVALLGSTGSIGEQAIDVIREADGRFRVVALAARRSAARLAAQARDLRPEVVALVDDAEAAQLARDLPAGCRLEVGAEAVGELAALDGAEVVLNGVTGSVGLLPTLRALEAGRRLALANPFRGRSAEELADVSPEEALAHPTWRMGPVVTTNSATLMNKGLEVIEAHLLFDIPFDRIEVVVHPQSIVHSMVEFRDGATIAQLSLPDMRLPIGLALGWPERPRRPVGRLDWSEVSTLEFLPVEREVFPLLDVAIGAGRRGGTAPAVLNAANEEAVAAFLAGRLRFPGIAEVVRQVLRDHQVPDVVDLDAVLEAEQWSRERARTLVEDLTPTGETA